MLFNLILKNKFFNLTALFCGFQPGRVRATDPIKKETYVRAKVWKVPDNNDYNNDESEYSNKRKVESENIAIFWAREFGSDPMLNPDVSKRFNVKEALKECERFYNFYVNDLKIVEKENHGRTSIRFCSMSSAGKRKRLSEAGQKIKLAYSGHLP